MELICKYKTLIGFILKRTVKRNENKWKKEKYRNACWVPLLDIFTRYYWYYGLLAWGL
jgi:hypothetical protein